MNAQQGNRLALDDIGVFLSKLAEKSDSVYWLSSADLSKIQYISPAYEKIWGRSREELYQDPSLWISYVHPDDVKDHHPIQNLIQRLQSLGASARYEENYRIIRPNGEIRWIIDRGFPIYDDLGNCCGVTGVAVDVTKEKQIEVTLKLAKEEAEQASRAKSEFLLNMRHDFRTPFSGILGLAEFMMEREDNLAKKENLSYITQSAQVLLDQLNELFEFVSLEDNMLPIVDKQFDVYQLLQNIDRIMRPSAVLKGLTLVMDVSKDVPQYLIGDHVRLSRIFVNLVSNAIKFTEKGFVSLHVTQASCEQKEVILKCVIEDTGIGIPSNKQDVIFERFTRLTPSYHGVYPGKGYGLRIVKRFLEDLHGEIHLSSEENKGTRFVVLVPYKVALIQLDEGVL